MTVAYQLMMGNEALAHGALRAGVRVVCGYPGTPSTEALEAVAALVRTWAHKGMAGGRGEVHVEWSVNEKAALEVAAGAAFCGARALVTMKQVGLNVASDPLMTLSYLGCKGGLVLYVADDPGPISSQTEQDTRQFAAFAKVPVLDAATPEDTWRMVQEAFDLSERHRLPVIVRGTTRVCHGSAPIEPTESYVPHPTSGFEKSPQWVTFPPLAYRMHCMMPDRTRAIAQEFDQYEGNKLCAWDVKGAPRILERSVPPVPVTNGVVASGISWSYLIDALALLGSQQTSLPPLRLLKIATPYPFPEGLASTFLNGLEQVLVFEELESCIERELLALVGAKHRDVRVLGKLSGHALAAGENSIETLCRQLDVAFAPDAGAPAAPAASAAPAAALIAHADAVDLPARPPVLCAGCPHRASFAAVKKALRRRPATCSGDIGCYTLGNAWPLEMVDTCVCMGAGITVAQGMHWAQPDVAHLGFVGDSTFFASGITGVVNAVYNQVPLTLFVLDNSITAMTGAQPHPGTGIRSSYDASPDDARHAVSIPAVLFALGVRHVVECDPLDFKKAVAAATTALDYDGVSAVVFRAPCVTLATPQPPPSYDAQACTLCRSCITQLGCPALTEQDDAIQLDQSLCFGCGLCAQVCAVGALQNHEDKDGRP
jgi:indolepyruvate ferredoxin oxidoreductase alpha subunit